MVKRTCTAAWADFYQTRPVIFNKVWLIPKRVCGGACKAAGIYGILTRCWAAFNNSLVFILFHFHLGSINFSIKLFLSKRNYILNLLHNQIFGRDKETGFKLITNTYVKWRNWLNTLINLDESNLFDWIEVGWQWLTKM